MIIVFFGQPHSGKSTLANELQKQIFIQKGIHTPIIDGDEIRNIFKNKNFSKAGRLRNLERISDITTYLFHKYEHIIVSAVYPYKESRQYLNQINETNAVCWIYLYYNEDRGREGFHVKDFDYPIDSKERILSINTDEHDIHSCINMVQYFYRTQKLNLTNDGQ